MKKYIKHNDGCICCLEIFMLIYLEKKNLSKQDLCNMLNRCSRSIEYYITAINIAFSNLYYGKELILKNGYYKII